MAIVRVEVDGLKQLRERLNRLNVKLAKKVARRALNAGATVIRKQAKLNAPVAPEPYLVDDGTELKQLVQPGNIGKNIIQKNVKTNEFIAAVVIAVRGKRKYGYANRIGSLKEFGTVKMAAEPFMRPALDEKGPEAIEVIKKRLTEELVKAESAPSTP